MAFIFDEPNKHIIVPAPDTEVTVQTIVNECRDFEDELVNLDILPLVSAAGKESLGGGTTVGITCTLLNGWKIKFEDRLGPTYVPCLISGGNLVSADESIPYTGSSFVTVGLSASSSATNQNAESLQYSSYGGGVTVDVTATHPYITGIIYPSGNKEFPVNNIPDAVLIANDKGFDTIFIIGDCTLDTGDNVDGFTLIGQNAIKTTLTINDGASTVQTEIFECRVTGVLDGGTTLRECILDTISYVNGFCYKCILDAGTITLADSLSILYLIDCYSGVPGSATPTIDCGGDGPAIAIRNYNGGIEFTNKTGLSEASIDVNSGHIKFTDTVTNGFFTVRGLGYVTDNSGPGCTVIDKLVDGDNMKNVQYLVEGLRESHEGTGNIWYWDPTNGDDSSTGKSVAAAVATFPAVMNKVIDNNHDVIIALDTNILGETIYTDPIVINKNWVSLRGPGISFKIQPTTTTINGALVDADGTTGIELTGIIIDGSSVNGTGLLLNSEECRLTDLFINNITGNGLYTEHCFTTFLRRVKFDTISGTGLRIENCRGLDADRVEFKDCNVGFHSTATGLGLGGETSLREVTFNDCITGIIIGTNVTNIKVYNSTVFLPNVTTTIIDNGVDTFIETSGGGGLNEADLHTGLDTYINKDDWKADVSNLSADVNIVEVNGVAVTDINDFKATTTISSNMRGTDNANIVVPDNANIALIKAKTDTLVNYDDTIPNGKLDSLDVKIDIIDTNVDDIETKVNALTNYDDTLISAKLVLLERLAKSSIKIEGTVLIMLDEIGELQRWNLADINSDPSNANVFYRTKI